MTYTPVLGDVRPRTAQPKVRILYTPLRAAAAAAAAGEIVVDSRTVW